MNQLTFGEADLASKGKNACKEWFLADMEQVVPWQSLMRLIEPAYPIAGNDRRPHPPETTLRGCLIQN
ncbi:MAG: hypothetical protein JNN30_08440 [Rhodanobacteraceae bacterium]|nr:hypothetical protein [Rhodanobacteraceae bacterium]